MCKSFLHVLLIKLRNGELTKVKIQNSVIQDNMKSYTSINIYLYVIVECKYFVIIFHLVFHIVMGVYWRLRLKAKSKNVKLQIK